VSLQDKIATAQQTEGDNILSLPMMTVLRKSCFIFTEPHL
jgi:hypothetical protein